MSTNSTTSLAFNPDAPSVKAHLATLNNRWKMRWFFLTRLPSAFWWGFKVKSCSPYRCEVEMPYGWRTQNPFKSIYFAAQMGAAELSTGLISIIAIKDRGRISMLVTNIEAKFVKKADAAITFTCDEGIKILDAVQKAIDTGEGVTATITSIGRLKDGKVVSEVDITWSFKVKK